MEEKMKMKTKKLVATLIPSFLLFCSVIVLNVNAENYKEYYTNSTFTAGSTVIIHYYHRADNSITLPVGKIYIYYELYDAEGNKVYKWVKTPRYYDYSVTHQYAEDYFTFKIPNMIGFIIFEDRPEGEWTLKASVHDSTGDVDFDSKRTYTFNVEKGAFIDNLFAPIYLYKGYKVFGIEIANFHVILPPIGYLLIPILVLILALLIIKYTKFVYKESKKFISLSSSKIKKEWRAGEEK